MASCPANGAEPPSTTGTLSMFCFSGVRRSSVVGHGLLGAPHGRGLTSRWKPRGARHRWPAAGGPPSSAVHSRGPACGGVGSAADLNGQCCPYPRALRVGTLLGMRTDQSTGAPAEPLANEVTERPRIDYDTRERVALAWCEDLTLISKRGAPDAVYVSPNHQTGRMRAAGEPSRGPSPPDGSDSLATTCTRSANVQRRAGPTIAGGD
jgi:hypothetical protein